MVGCEAKEGHPNLFCNHTTKDLHNEQWEADIVVMLQWYDPRVSGLVPKERFAVSIQAPK
jgi:hypothetical protein